jgi:type II secretory pathway pseudopilin PulG
VVWLAVVVFVVLALGACSDEAQDQVGQGTEGRDTAAVSETGGADIGGEAPEVSAPPATDPPSAEPPTTEAPSAESPTIEVTAEGEQQVSSDDEMTTEEWILLGILALAAIALIVGVTSAAHNHSEKKAAAQAEQNRTIGQIVGTSRWVHDQGSVEVLRQSDPGQLTRSWDDVRGRMVGLESEIATKRASTQNADLERALGTLGQSVAGLRGALSSYVSLRTDAGAQPDLIQDASQTARERRQQLAAAIDPVAAAQR